MPEVLGNISFSLMANAASFPPPHPPLLSSPLTPQAKVFISLKCPWWTELKPSFDQVVTERLLISSGFQVVPC